LELGLTCGTGLELESKKNLVKNQTWNPISLSLSLSLSLFPFMCGIGIGIDIFEKKD
jgi:hypothetical protein